MPMMSWKLLGVSLLVWLLAIALGNAYVLEYADNQNEEKNTADLEALFINAESSLSNLKQHLDDLKQNVAKFQHRKFSASFHSFKEQLIALLNKFELEVSDEDETTSEPPVEPTKELPILRHCADVYEYQSHISGVYTIQPPNSEPFQVYCDMTTDGGGWTVFQKRGEFPGIPMDNFKRNWQAYKDGFGDLETEFWIGLSKVSLLTRSETRNQELRVDMTDQEGNRRYAKYLNFVVEDEKEDFRLRIGNYSGDAGDSLTYHNQQKFTTYDRDNDAGSFNCADHYSGGGWWYNSCHESCLNGWNLRDLKNNNGKGIQWRSWKGTGYSLSQTEMKFRPMNWTPKKNQ